LNVARELSNETKGPTLTLVTIVCSAIAIGCSRPSVRPPQRASPSVDSVERTASAFPTVGRASLTIDTVKRGAMNRRIEAPGLRELGSPVNAKIRVPEMYAEDLVAGLPATIDLDDNTVVRGHVARTDPATTPGVLMVEVHIDDPLPPGVRSNAAADGIFQLEPLRNVLFVARPMSGGRGTVGVFRIVPNAGVAERIWLRLGRIYPDAAEITNGAKVGDSLIVNEMSQFDAVNRVRIK
jgi:multidrug efflux pump subunit AcrA (membrane-fusion protein)